jgi:hypothetical protein
MVIVPKTPSPPILLVKVTVLGALIVPSAWPPKSRDATSAVMPEAACNGRDKKTVDANSVRKIAAQRSLFIRNLSCSISDPRTVAPFPMKWTAIVETAIYIDTAALCLTAWC